MKPAKYSKKKDDKPTYLFPKKQAVSPVLSPSVAKKKASQGKLISRSRTAFDEREIFELAAFLNSSTHVEVADLCSNASVPESKKSSPLLGTQQSSSGLGEIINLHSSSVVEPVLGENIDLTNNSAVEPVLNHSVPSMVSTLGCEPLTGTAGDITKHSDIHAHTMLTKEALISPCFDEDEDREGLLESVGSGDSEGEDSDNDIDVKSAVKLLFSFQKFLSSRLIHHARGFDGDNNEFCSPTGSPKTKPKTRIFEGDFLWNSQIATPLHDGFISPIMRANGNGHDNGHTLSMMKNSDLSSIASPDLNGHLKSQELDPNVLCFRTPFIWYFHMVSLHKFTNPLSGNERWLGNEVKLCITTALCRTIMKRWCLYSGVMSHARIAGDHMALRRGLNRWLEHLFKLKLNQSTRIRSASVSVNNCNRLTTTKYRHFNVSSARSLVNLRESSVDQGICSRRRRRSSRVANTSRSLFSLGELNSNSNVGGSGTGFNRVLSSHMATPAPISSASNRVESVDTFLKFSNLNFLPGSALTQSQLVSPDTDSVYIHNDSTVTDINTNNTGNGNSVMIDREYIRDVWSRSGPFATPEGCAFQILGIRRLYKRTVLFARAKRVKQLVELNVTKRYYSEWHMKLRNILKFETWLDEVKVPYVEKHLVKHRKRKAFRMLREFRVWSLQYSARETKTMNDIRQNVLSCKAVRLFYCPAYVKCFYGWKKYYLAQSSSPKVFKKASRFHNAVKCRYALRQWRYYLGVTEQNLLQQQLRQINRLRLFGLRVTLLSLVDSANDQENSSSGSGAELERDGLATSRMSIAELEELLNVQGSEDLSSSNNLGTNASSASNSSGASSSSKGGLSTISNAALRRKHPLLWKDYSSLYGSIKNMDERQHRVFTENNSSSSSDAMNSNPNTNPSAYQGCIYSSRKRQLNSVRDYLVLLTNRVKYLRCLKKLKLYSIIPRLFFSPADVLRSELNADTNSKETRKMCISIRDKGSTRYTNVNLVIQQQQQVNCYSKGNYAAKASTTNISNNPSNTYSRIFHEVGGGLCAFQYTSCIMINNHTTQTRKSGIVFNTGTSRNTRSEDRYDRLANLRYTSSTNKYSQYVCKKSKRLCVKSGRYIYSTVATEDSSPYLHHIYHCKKNHNDINMTSVGSVGSSGGEYITGGHSHFVRDSASGIISTRSSMYLVHFRRFLNKCRINISVRRKANAVKANIYHRFGSSIMNIWKFAYMEEKRYRLVLYKRGMICFKWCILRKRSRCKFIRKSDRYELLKHWKVFKYTLREWKANRSGNKQHLLSALINPLPIQKVPRIDNSNSISALTLFDKCEVQPESKSKIAKHNQVRYHTMTNSIKKYFPITKEYSELFRKLSHYLILSQYKAGVMKALIKLELYMQRKHKIKWVLYEQLNDIKRKTIYKLKRNAHIRICYQIVRNKIYHKRLFHWKVITIQRKAYINTLACILKSWRLCYLHNLALRVWFRPIIEKQQNAFSKWKVCVKEVQHTGEICIENFRLNRIHNIFTKWSNLRKSIVLYKRNMNIHLLVQFGNYCNYIRIPQREYELLAIFFRFKQKIMKSKIRSRQGFVLLQRWLEGDNFHSNSNSKSNSNSNGEGLILHTGKVRKSKRNKNRCRQYQIELVDSITKKYKEKRALTRWRFLCNFGFMQANLEMNSDMHFNRRQLAIGLHVLKYHVVAMRKERMHMKSEALSTLKKRTLATMREYQLCCLSSDFYIRKHAKYCFQKWLWRTKKHLSTYRSMRTAKRYRSNRLIGVALLLFRNLISSD